MWRPLGVSWVSVATRGDTGAQSCQPRSSSQPPGSSRPRRNVGQRWGCSRNPGWQSQKLAEAAAASGFVCNAGLLRKSAEISSIIPLTEYLEYFRKR